MVTRRDFDWSFRCIAPIAGGPLLECEKTAPTEHLGRLIVCCAVAMALSCSLLAAQDPGSAPASTAPASTAPTPLTPRNKLIRAARDSVEWSEFVLTGALAFVDHSENVHPGFGRGLRGYSKRYAGLYADDAIGTLLAEGLLPVVFHEDPRYFRTGGGVKLPRRLGIALRQTVVRREDSGKWHINRSEILGKAAAAGISNIYYRDSRTPSANLQRFGIQIGGEALTNVVREFWPDIRHRLFESIHDSADHSQSRPVKNLR